MSPPGLRELELALAQVRSLVFVHEASMSAMAQRICELEKRLGFKRVVCPTAQHFCGKGEGSTQRLHAPPQAGSSPAPATNLVHGSGCSKEGDPMTCCPECEPVEAG